MKRRIALLSLFTVLTGVAAVGYNVPSALAFVFGPGASANGHGHFSQDGDLRTFSFHATTRKNETVTGSLTLHNRQSDTFIKADIDCLRVVDNTASMSGFITHSNDENLEGRRVFFKVEDNGEGNNSPGDMLSLLAILPTASTTDCNTNLALAMNPIEGGNIQVKP